MKAELEKLIALQNLDTSIRKLEKDLEAIPERRAAIEAEFDRRAFEIRALESRRDDARHTRARLENEVTEQKGRVERADEIATLNSDREARLKLFDEETKSQSELLATQRVERDQLFANLPNTMSGMYARIRARIRDGVAVAEARNRSCSACFMSLRPQVMAEIRRGEDVMTCDNCGRILYYIAEPLQADSAATHPNVAIT